MIKGKYIWKIPEKGIVSDNEIFKVLLENRKIRDYETFFSMGKEKLHNPFLLNDMEKAVNRIRTAIQNQEKIMIFGDYDCDGISSIALLFRALTKAGALVDYDLPDRFSEGYGLNERAVKDIISSAVKLVITVDNGITCVDEVKALSDAGIDTIITDHHEPGEILPQAFAIVHPKLSPNYPFKEIAGVMVAYKLASALTSDYLDELIDLAMVGTIADLMPLENENQAMVNLGIERIKTTTNIGLRKLISFSNLDIINVTAIAFKIAPKINSSGRLNKAKEAVELLITEDIKRANELILDIEKNHHLRKQLTEEAFLVCEELVNPDDLVLVVASEKLHEGVIGICAQRLVEKYQKSTIVITIDKDHNAKGSARSFGDANILEMLNQNSEFIDRYGGHSQACGLQLSVENIEKLRNGLNHLHVSEVNPVLKADMEIYLPDIKVETIKNIQDKSFFTATYIMRNLRVAKKQILKVKHTKLTLEIDGYFFDALDFNNLEFYYNLNLGDRVDICGGLNINSYRNKDHLQIMIKDIKTDEFQVYDYRNSYDQNLDNLYEYIVHYSDDFVIENDDYLKKITQDKAIALLPKTKKYNLNQIVDRVELGKIYRYLEKLKTFKLSDINQEKFDEFTLNTALGIFLELGLITLNENRYQIKLNSVKIDLNSSKIYQKTLEKYHHITYVYQNDLPKLKTYFMQILEE